jgi:hypothetical protein
MLPPSSGLKNEPWTNYNVLLSTYLFDPEDEGSMFL